MGILKPSNEFRVSGAIFDYLTIFFMQSYYGVPIINEVVLLFQSNNYVLHFSKRSGVLLKVFCENLSKRS